MLLFSTILSINQSLTREKFIELIIQWNQGSPHLENRIPDICWNEKSNVRNVRFGTDALWLEIQEYQKEDILAVRFEQHEEDGVIWDTDYIVNFKTMQLAIRLDRSFLAEALTISPRFKTPHFIRLLIDGGYLETDEGLKVLATPHIIRLQNLELLTDVINGNVHYRLPVVYVSRTYSDEEPVNTEMLALQLKGAAHVLVQESNSLDLRIRELTADQNEYRGAIGIYFPTQAIGHRRYLYRTYTGAGTALMQKVVSTVIQYGNSQLIHPLLTWQGVSRALLQDRLQKQREGRALAEDRWERAVDEMLALKENLDKTRENMQRSALEDAKAEADSILEGVDEEIRGLQDEISRLNREVGKLEVENAGLRAKLDENTTEPVLFTGTEGDFYPGEIKDLLLSTLKKGLEGIEPGTRRHDVVADIIASNHYQASSEERAKKAKELLKNYTGMTPRVKKGLEDIGYEVTHEGDHYKAAYHGDDRYIVVHAATPSDSRSGKNNASNTIKKSF